MKKNIYLVEDEDSLNKILKKYLEKEGYQVKSFLDGSSAYERVKDSPDLWILDIMLPGINGFEIIKAIKDFNKDTPVIFISARNQDLDRVIGLEMGSDDYISKPFLPRELVLRVNKIFKNSFKNNEKEKTIAIGDYTIITNSRIVKLLDETIDLTSKEYDFLIFLGENKMHSFSREEILNRVWGEDYFGSDRVVDDTIRRIRKKMPKINIETIYGYGYRMVK